MKMRMKILRWDHHIHRLEVVLEDDHKDQIYKTDEADDEVDHKDDMKIITKWTWRWQWR